MNRKLPLMHERKELPATTLPGETGMHLFVGGREGNGEQEFRFRVYVPTTIYNSLYAKLMVYKVHPDNVTWELPKTPERVVAERYVRLSSLPRWNVGGQHLALNEKDEQAVFKAFSSLEKKVLGRRK